MACKLLAESISPPFVVSLCCTLCLETLSKGFSLVEGDFFSISQDSAFWLFKFFCLISFNSTFNFLDNGADSSYNSLGKLAGRH